MSAVSRPERLRPPLMYAFRQAHGGRDARRRSPPEGGERVPPARASITEHELRKQVGLDIEVLMNSVNLSSTVSIEAFPEVLQSIVNYGLPAIVHRFAEEAAMGDIQNEIRTALETFEPRLVAQTIRVTLDADAGHQQSAVRFRVEADLVCEPVNVPVEFIADLELDTGKVSVGRR